MTTQIKAGVIAANAVNSSELASGALSGQNFTGDVTFDTTTLVIDSSNNRVGIGTASPDTLNHLLTSTTSAITPVLKLQGNFTANDSSEGTSIDFVGSSDATAVGSRIIGTRAAAGGNMDLRFHTARDAFAMIIDESQNVGIGVSSPEKALHIRSISNQLRLQDSTNDKKYDLNVDGNNFSIDDMSAGASRFTIKDGGNVGIGTSSPSEKLHIAQSTADNLILKLEQDNASYESWFEANCQDGGFLRSGISTNTNNFAFFNTDQASLRFLLSADEKMRIDSATGNVGIGTGSPDTKLTVGTFGDTARAAAFNGGSILVDGGAASEIIIGDGNVAYMSIQTTDNATAMNIRNFSGSADLVTIERASGNVGIGTTSPSEMLHMNNTTATGCFIRFQNTGGSGVYIGGRSEVMEMYTNGSEKMRITSTGNVGIGMNNPSAKLEVQDANGVSLKFGDLASYPNNVVPCFIGTATSALAGVNGDLVLVPRTSDAGKIIFATGNGGAATEKVRIANDGNVGIGQTNPGVKLEIGENSSSTNVGYIRLRGHNTLEGNIYKDATYGLHFDTNSNNQPIRIDGSKQILGITGNVGIGTENPSSSAKLDVNGVFALKGNDFLDSDTSAHYIKAPTALYFYTNASDIAFQLKQNMLAEFRKPSSRVASFGLSDANDKYITFYNSSGNFDIGTHTSNRHYLYGNGDIPISIFTNQVERVTIDDKGIKQYNRFVSGTILPTAFVGCDSWYDLSGRYSTVVTSGNDLTSCTDASGEGRSTLIKNTVATGLNNNASLEQFPSGIYGFRFNRASYITGTSHTSGYLPPSGTNARTLWCIIYNFQEIGGEPINHFLHYGSNTTSKAFGIVFTTSSNEFGQHLWAGSGQEVDADTDIAGGFTDNGTTPRDVYVLFSSYDGGTGETRVYRGGMEGVSSIGSISINTGAGYALHVGSRINADNSDENCNAVIGEFGAFSRRLTTKEMDLMASSLLLRWS